MAFGTREQKQQDQAVGGNTAEREKVTEQEQRRELSFRQGTSKKEFHFDAPKEELEQRLMKPRSREYLTAIDLIDFLSADDKEIIERLKADLGEDFVEEVQELTDDEILEMILEGIREEFADLETELDEIQIGILAKCYVDGCDCHLIDAKGNIREHCRRDKRLPDDLEWGRMIWRQYEGHCKNVEVYKTNCKVILQNGDVEVIRK